MVVDIKTLKTLEYDKVIKKLAEFSLSIPGEELCIHLEPKGSFLAMEQSLKETDEGVSIILSGVDFPLQGLHDIRPIMSKIKVGGILEPGELLNISSILACCRKIRKFLKDKGKKADYPLIEGMIEGIEELPQIESRINKTIISESEIADEASPELGRLRREIRSVQGKIKDKLQDIIQSPSYQRILQEPIVTIRNGRYVVPVKREHVSAFPGLVHDQSTSGATQFVEPMSVVNMNNQLREVELKEKREIEKILKELTQLVTISKEEIKWNSDTLYKIDFIMAKSKFALDINGVGPEINSTGKINIRKGRHPLIDPKVVVPTDIHLGMDFKTLVITGPNTGGKTVTLKTVGLLTLMAQSGLYIPASYGSEISFFEGVFADIGDEQSIEQSLSTFSSHMKNIVAILPKSGANSLVLLDELGAGTDPTEGAALAMAILDFLHSKNTTTIATTHYSELKIYGLKKEGVENASVEFDLETLSPTYRLFIGIPGKSNAFEISSRLGLNKEIIANARTLLNNEDIRFEDVLKSIHHDKSVIEEERSEIERLKAELQELKKHQAFELERIKTNKDRIIERAKEEALQIINSAIEESQGVIKELREKLKAFEGNTSHKDIEIARSKLKDMKEGFYIDDDLLVDHEDINEDTFKPGDSVLLIDLNQKGILLDIQRNEGVVQAGILKLNVPLAKLRKVKDSNKKVESQQNSRIKANKAAVVSPKIDVRGKNLEESLEILDKYLDDAFLAGLTSIEIIHGKGTGVLRKGIQDHLKSHPHIKTYRTGIYGEGGEGVTIAYFKE
jgi:DNA mismatch repair protein MutS2